MGPLVFRTNQNVPADIPVQNNQPQPSTSQQGRILPSELQQPRVVDQHNFPQAPVESVGPSRRPIHSPMVEREIQTEQPEVREQGVQADIPAAPVSHPIPRMEDQGTQTRPGIVPPRPVRPLHFPSGGDIGGGYPPRFPPGGGGEDNSGQPSNRILFYLVVLSVCYTGYRWALVQFQTEIETELNRLEEEREKDIGPEDEANGGSASNVLAPKNPRPVFAVWRARSLRGLWEGGLLVGSVLGGSGTFRRAFNLIALPRLQRLVGAYVPRFARMVLSPLVTMVGKFGLWAFRAFSPVTNIICFFLTLDGLKRLFLLFGSSEWVEPLIPVITSTSTTIQNFFATPTGVSVQVSFLEKTVKVVCATLFFGGILNQFFIFFKKDNNKFLSLILISGFGFSIFIILNDHRFVILFVQNMVCRFPWIQNLAEQPLGQVSLLFGSGVLIQSARLRFPLLVNYFFILLLYVSGVYRSILSANLPFLPKK